MNIDRLHKYHFGLILFIIIYLIFAILNYKEFPISADEEFRYTRGKELLNFYLNSQPRQTYFEPKILPDQFYFYNLIQNVINPNFFYEWFHLQNIVFSSIIFVVFYFLLYSYTKNQYFSVFGITVLFFTPNFTGHIAFNPVDMPFAVMFLLNIYLIYLYKDIEFDFKKIVILGFSFWFLIGIRPIGFQIFLLYLLFTLFYKFNDKKYLISQFKNLTLISIISLFLLTISWPYLGVNIYKNLFYTFSSTASFDNWNRLILFDGELISKENREWHYLFTYFGLTTPIYILVLLLMSFINLKNSLKKSLIFVLFFNLLVYILINPVIYNGLRHFLYLIPIIVLISLFNLYDFLNLKINRMFKLIIILFICLNLFSTIFQMYRLFPLHYS